MKFKGTIIITDPCYIVRDYDETYPKFETWPGLEGVSQFTKFRDYTEEQMKAYRCYEKACRVWEEEYDDWNKCGMGEFMEGLGINHCIVEDTIYGDWSCGTYKVDENPRKLIDRPVKEECDIEATKLGSFCADAGKVAVFLLDEVRQYNPKIDDWIAEHPWCVTTIKDFDGDVEYYVDNEGDAHIYGIGNISFLTLQTGL